MTCPFAKFTTSNEVSESQKVSYKIYDMEEEILKTTKHLEKLREARKRLEVEDEMERLGTVENVEKEFNKIFGSSLPTTFTTAAEAHRSQRRANSATRGWATAAEHLKPLLTSIVYTLKDFNKRLNEGKVHVHDENIPLKFTKLPEQLAQPLFGTGSPPAPPCEAPDDMDKIWAANEFEIGDEELVAEVLSGLAKVPDHPIEFDPKNGTTYCSDKPSDSFTFSPKDY